MSTNKFALDYSKRLSKCQNQKCKQEIPKGSVRLAKLVPNFFGSSDDGDMKQFYHIDCLFDTFKRAKATTKIIEETDDIENFSSANEKDKKKIIEAIEEIEKARKPKISSQTKLNFKPEKKKLKNNSNSDTDIESDTEKVEETKKKRKNESGDEKDDEKKDKKIKEEDENSDDNKFETFRLICDEISEQSGHLKKTSILKTFFTNGINGGIYDLIKFNYFFQ